MKFLGITFFTLCFFAAQTGTAQADLMEEEGILHNTNRGGSAPNIQAPKRGGVTVPNTQQIFEAVTQHKRGKTDSTSSTTKYTIQRNESDTTTKPHTYQYQESDYQFLNR